MLAKVDLQSLKLDFGRRCTALALATEADLEVALAKQTVTIITWTTAMLLAQGALVVSLLQYFK